jgi:hypothetical protein
VNRITHRAIELINRIVELINRNFHRCVYGGLSACHFSACLLTGKPELYAPMATLYLILAAKHDS